MCLIDSQKTEKSNKRDTKNLNTQLGLFISDVWLKIIIFILNFLIWTFKQLKTSIAAKLLKNAPIVTTPLAKMPLR